MAFERQEEWIIAIHRLFRIENVKKPGGDEVKTGTVGHLSVVKRIRYTSEELKRVREERDRRALSLGSPLIYYGDDDWHSYAYLICYCFECDGIPTNCVVKQKGQSRLIEKTDFYLTLEDADVLVPPEYKGKALKICCDDCGDIFQGRKCYIQAGESCHDTDGGVVLFSSYDLISAPGHVTLENSMRATKAFYDLVTKDPTKYRFTMRDEKDFVMQLKTAPQVINIFE